jgi:hypothetical protein
MRGEDVKEKRKRRVAYGWFALWRLLQWAVSSIHVGLGTFLLPFDDEREACEMDIPVSTVSPATSVRKTLNHVTKVSYHATLDTVFNHATFSTIKPQTFLSHILKINPSPPRTFVTVGNLLLTKYRRWKCLSGHLISLTMTDFRSNFVLAYIKICLPN